MSLTSREIVSRAIEFKRPPRLPFWQHEDPAVPDDVCDVWEMDRAQAGWFFDHPVMDDWGCGWERTEVDNMGQVTGHPLADWAALNAYRPPDPRNPFYFERIEGELAKAGDRYVVVTSHFTLLERLHMLHGFAATMEDFYLEPELIERVLDLVLEFKLAQFDELHRRFGDRVHGIFMTDDWGTQQSTFVGTEIFDRFFAARYKSLFGALRAHGWHAILHSCGRVNAFVPRFIDAGVDVLNMQQPRAYGLVEFGEEFKGKVAFLTTVDIQSTLPRGNEAEIREEASLLVKHWSTADGGFVVFNYGDPSALAVHPEISRVMFDEFGKLMDYWSG
ncbi:MAG: uroporphyrinogen decarboxylase family protein [Armatimonadota bacterium]